MTALRVAILAIGLFSAPMLTDEAVSQGRAVMVPRSEILKRLASTYHPDSVRIVKAGIAAVVPHQTPTPLSQVALRATDTVLALHRGDVVVVPGGRASQRDSDPGHPPDAHVDLPNSYLTPDESGTRLVTFSIRVRPAAGGLTFDVRNGSFSGEVLIGLEDRDTPTRTSTLGGAIVLQVTSDGGPVTPGTIRIAHTNIPWTTVRIVAHEPGDSVHLRVQATFDPEGYAALIPVERSRLDVRAAAPRIQGLGLEMVKVSVTVPEFLRRDSNVVVLSSDHGGLDVATLLIPRSGTAETSLRSQGLGTNRVHAALGHVAAGEETIAYVFPWTFLAAVLVGGVLGSFLAKRERHRRRTDLVLGVVTGFLCAVAYAIGLNLTGLDINVRVGEATVLVVAAIGAAYDLPGLAPLRKRLDSAA
jgi:hypothetical protein